MAVKELLLLGNPKLYEKSEYVKSEELSEIKSVVEDLHDTLMDFRAKYGIGRAISAPQIGVMKRLIYMHTDRPIVIINPELTFRHNGTMEVWDDCMSFPDLLVKVMRHKSCHVEFRDLNWKKYFMVLEGSQSELLQHELDHLNGILAISRAINSQAFRLRAEILKEESTA
ncbi:MAG: peptide deformylase [Syntrophothermus sp.]